MKVLLIDFYDSFTYNIYHYLIGCGVDAKVVEDGKLDINEIEFYDAVIFSPGPEYCAKGPDLETSPLGIDPVELL